MKESQLVEWKETWRDEYLKWICGFANAKGGILVIGRNDRGQAVGVAYADKMMEDLPNKIRDVLGIMVDVNLLEEGGNELVEIRVDPYPYPVSYKGEYHYRTGSTKQELKGAALDKFLLQKQGRHWDGVVIPSLKPLALSGPAIEMFRRRARQSGRVEPSILRESRRVLIEKLHLMDGPRLKRAAVLLFHSDPERFISGAFVKIGFFRTNADLLYHDEVHGDLFTQVDKTMDLLLTKYLKAGIEYEGVQRVETFPVPEPALRESLLNALIHKNYAAAAPVQISVYRDRLMIWNPGELPQDWTVANLKGKHPSQPFNPDVANAFFRAGMIEAWGRGIERILSECLAQGFPAPEFRYERTGLWVEFPFPVKGASTGSQETPGKTPVKTPVKTPDRILEFLKADPGLSLLDVAAQIGKSLRAVERATSNLVKRGKLRRIGPSKGGRWEVLP